MENIEICIALGSKCKPIHAVCSLTIFLEIWLLISKGQGENKIKFSSLSNYLLSHFASRRKRPRTRFAVTCSVTDRSDAWRKAAEPKSYGVLEPEVERPCLFSQATGKVN